MDVDSQTDSVTATPVMAASVAETPKSPIESDSNSNSNPATALVASKQSVDVEKKIDQTPPSVASSLEVPKEAPFAAAPTVPSVAPTPPQTAVSAVIKPPISNAFNSALSTVNAAPPPPAGTPPISQHISAAGPQQPMSHQPSIVAPPQSAPLTHPNHPSGHAMPPHSESAPISAAPPSGTPPPSQPHQQPPMPHHHAQPTSQHNIPPHMAQHQGICIIISIILSK